MPLHRVRLPVAGMTGERCKERVRAALEGAGARRARVNWRRGEAWFTLPRRVELGALRAAVRGAGYQPGEIQRPRPT